MNSSSTAGGRDPRDRGRAAERPGVLVPLGAELDDFQVAHERHLGGGIELGVDVDQADVDDPLRVAA